jgi:hypothetical protein
MNDSFSNIDERLLDRLVDGELLPEERRELLAAVETQPGGWRRCALAFLEAQTWRQEMRQFVVAPSAGETAAASAVCEPPVVKQIVTTNPEPPRRSQAVRWFAIAASLAIAFGLGQHFTSRSSSPGASSENARQMAAIDTPAPASGDAVTLVVNDPQGVPHRVRVPLVEGRRLGAQFAETPTWSESPELTRQLNEQGLGLTARRRYAPMYFEQQNQLVPMIVPVDDAVVTPVSRPVF